mmetsp:Transcript_60766/g.177538  ORF Transcript_60766/g.177538 Transcript_60766/m.177538 type:complete len:232 (+) Transcript_60766:4781-5476(+)
MTTPNCTRARPSGRSAWRKLLVRRHSSSRICRSTLQNWQKSARLRSRLARRPKTSTRRCSSKGKSRMSSSICMRAWNSTLQATWPVSVFTTSGGEWISRFVASVFCSAISGMLSSFFLSSATLPSGRPTALASIHSRYTAKRQWKVAFKGLMLRINWMSQEQATACSAGGVSASWPSPATMRKRRWRWRLLSCRYSDRRFGVTGLPSSASDTCEVTEFRDAGLTESSESRP